jgi:GNAT superfamily N-acetyltransferase
MSNRPRTVTQADFPSVVRLLDAAYGPNPTFPARFRAYSSLEPEGWVVVDGTSTPLGVGGFVAFGRCAYIGLMAVSPDAQRRGIGAAIFEEILTRCEARGCALQLLDASQSGAPLYEKYSFRDHGTSLSCTLDPSEVRPAEDDAGDVRIDPLDVADAHVAAEIERFDARGFGAGRAPLVRRAIRELAGRVFAARDREGRLVGYAVGQARSFGPCMALSPEIARALARRTLTLPYEGRVTWLVAAQNRDAVATAEALGGVAGRTWRHMRRGDGALLASDWSSLFAKMSLAVG